MLLFTSTPSHVLDQILFSVFIPTYCVLSRRLDARGRLVIKDDVVELVEGAARCQTSTPLKEDSACGLRHVQIVARIIHVEKMILVVDLDVHHLGGSSTFSCTLSQHCFFIQLGLQGALAAREPVEPRRLRLFLLLYLFLPAVCLAILSGLIHDSCGPSVSVCSSLLLLLVTFASLSSTSSWFGWLFVVLLVWSVLFLMSCPSLALRVVSLWEMLCAIVLAVFLATSTPFVTPVATLSRACVALLLPMLA